MRKVILELADDAREHRLRRQTLVLPLLRPVKCLAHPVVASGRRRGLLLGGLRETFIVRVRVGATAVLRVDRRSPVIVIAMPVTVVALVLVVQRPYSKGGHGGEKAT